MTSDNGPDRQWWRGATIYQIYPRSYQDSNNDGVGDLAGIEQRLQYVASLGVDGIWISPFYTSPMKDFGYDVSDYCDVDPVFGTLADFDRLIATAHRLNLKVIIDQVYSHTSDLHPWFTESRASRDNPKADWYVWADPKPDGSPPSNWQSVFTGPAWTWDAHREQYYMHNFLTEQPDLNLHNRDVQDALLNVARFWLERGVDGFRLDAINHGMHDQQLRDNPVAQPEVHRSSKPYLMQEPRHTQNHADMPALLARFRALHNEYGCVFSVAEVGGSDPLPTQKAYTADNKHLNSAYGFEFLHGRLNAERVRAVASRWSGEPDEGWPSWAFSNHDAPRVVSRWASGSDPANRAKLFALLQIALRGNVFIYQGEELGLPQADVPFEKIQDPEALNNWPKTAGRDGARTPMPWQADATFAGFSSVEPWLPFDPRHVELAVDRQDAQADSVLQFFRQAIALRKAHDVLRCGSLTFLPGDNDTLAFTREHGSKTALCVFNLSAAAATYQHALLAAGEMSITVGLRARSGSDSIDLPAYSGLIVL